MNENNDNIRFLSVLSYLPFGFVVGHFAVEKDNPDLRFHKFQGCVLFGTFACFYLLIGLVVLLLSFSDGLQSIFGFVLTAAVTLAYLLLIGFGISSAWRFQQKQLPFIGFLSVRLREMMDAKRK